MPPNAAVRSSDSTGLDTFYTTSQRCCQMGRWGILRKEGQHRLEVIKSAKNTRCRSLDWLKSKDMTPRGHYKHTVILWKSYTVTGTLRGKLYTLMWCRLKSRGCGHESVPFVLWGYLSSSCELVSLRLISAEYADWLSVALRTSGENEPYSGGKKKPIIGSWNSSVISCFFTDPKRKQSG